MKRIFLLVVALLLNTGMESICEADVYFVFTGGNGGQADVSSIGAEGGWIGKRVLLGIGYAQLSNDNTVPQVTSSGTNYFVYKKEEELYGSLGVKLIDDLFLVGNAGYSQQLIEFRSFLGVTFDEDPKRYFTYGGQLQYTFHHIVIGAGYHNRRGIVGKIGFSF
jgi:hypothetical protein